MYLDKQKELVNHIRDLGVKDQGVLDAFMTVPRHEFVLEEYRDEAYLDEPLPIGEGQTISQPSLVASMLETLDLKGGERVLEIGTGSGFETAILSKLAKEVYSIEYFSALNKKARAILKKLKIGDIYLKVGDGREGWREFAPFDAIIVTACAVRIPDTLIDQLKEGGKIIIPIGKEPSSQNLILGIKNNGILRIRTLEPVSFVPLLRKSLSDIDHCLIPQSGVYKSHGS